MPGQVEPTKVAPAGRARDVVVVIAATLTVAAVGVAVVVWAKPWESDRNALPPAPGWTTGHPSVAPGGGPSAGTPTAGGGAATPTAPSERTDVPRSPTPSTPGPPVGRTQRRGPAGEATPPSGAVNLSLEAEAPSTTRSGRTRIQSLSGASGGAVIRRIGDGPEHRVRFAPVTVAASTTYALTIEYVSTQRRQAVVTVNGAAAVTVDCPPSGGKTVASVTVPLSLPAGASTIEYGNDAAKAPDLDRIVLVRGRL